MARYEHTGAAPAETLTSGIDGDDMVFALAGGGSGYPTGTIGAFWLVLDPGTASEEHVLAVSRAGAAVTVATSGRGADGTLAVSHAAGAVVLHGFSAVEADQANAHVEATGNVHGVSGPVAGVSATQTMTNKSISGSANTLTNLPTGAVTGLQATLDALDARLALYERPGLMLPYAAPGAPGGWLLCDGRAVSRGVYADLFGAIGQMFGSGDGSSTFNLPDMRGRVPMGAGDGPSLTARTRGDAPGSEERGISAAMLPPHSHSMNHDHGNVLTASEGAHSHTLPFSTVDAGVQSEIHVKNASDSAGRFNSGWSGQAPDSGAHRHNVNVPALSGSTGNGPGSSNPMNIIQPSTVVNFIIKT